MDQDPVAHELVAEFFVALVKARDDYGLVDDAVDDDPWADMPPLEDYYPKDKGEIDANDYDW